MNRLYQWVIPDASLIWFHDCVGIRHENGRFHMLMVGGLDVGYICVV
jgi:hypothetical protein